MSQEFVLTPEPLPQLDRSPKTVVYDAIIKAFIKKHVARARVDLNEPGFNSSTLYTGLRYRLKHTAEDSIRVYKRDRKVFLVNSALFKIRLEE
jgi:hypothetical protein